jgi:hypothetical protein
MMIYEDVFGVEVKRKGFIAVFKKAKHRQLCRVFRWVIDVGFGEFFIAVNDALKDVSGRKNDVVVCDLISRSLKFT